MDQQLTRHHVYAVCVIILSAQEEAPLSSVWRG